MGFELSAPSTRRNAARLLRAMQLPKPILLEGSPGVGKTSLVSALAKAAGHNLVRINLSEQTDMMDLLGADLPADGGAAGEFRWADGAFLAALKNGDWVLLDELNLAPQPVLEGLNAALDHRAEVFVPELGETFRCPPTFRVFAAQNPVQEGGGRKGLPKSFLNRFTRVHVEPMESSDLVHITRALYPRIPATVVERMVAFTAALSAAASVSGGIFARAGAPWEFNLRDLLRWCDLIEAAAATAAADDPDSADSNGRTQTDVELAMDAAERAVDATFATLFVRRLRTAADRAECAELFASAFGRPPTPPTPPAVAIRDGALRVGHAVFPCGGASANVEHDTPLGLLRGQLGALEAAAHCAARGWMTIVVGPPASGKTSLVQTLASLAGRTLRQVALTAATDTSELLGSFEQKESARDRATIEAEALAALRASAADALAPATTAETARGDADDSNDDATRATESAWAAWSRYRAIIEASAESTSAEDAEAAKAALDAALVAIETLRVAAGARDDDADEDAMDEGREGVEGSIASLRARAARLGPEAWGGGARPRLGVSSGWTASCSKPRFAASGCSSRTPTCVRRRCSIDSTRSSRLVDRSLSASAACATASRGSSPRTRTSACSSRSIRDAAKFPARCVTEASRCSSRPRRRRRGIRGWDPSIPPSITPSITSSITSSIPPSIQLSIPPSPRRSTCPARSTPRRAI